MAESYEMNDFDDSNIAWYDDYTDVDDEDNTQYNELLDTLEKEHPGCRDEPELDDEIMPWYVALSDDDLAAMACTYNTRKRAN
jgi:hypothetical protein